MALFFFNIVVSNVFVVAVFCAAVGFVASKERLFLYEALLVGCFLLDHLISFAAQFLFHTFPLPEIDYDLITAPSLRIFFFVARQLVYLLVAKELFGLEYPKWTYLVFPVLFVLYWNLRAQVAQADERLSFMLFAFYSVMQVYLLVLLAICYTKTASEQHAHLKPLLHVTLLLIVLILALDITWLLDLYNPFHAIFDAAQEFNFFETLLHLIYSVLIIRSAIRWFTAQAELGESKAASIDEEAVSQTIRDLQLTKREAEVFRLLLEDYSYQDICDKLVISMSTVKSHAHNVYDKAGCSRRSELRRLVTRGDRP